MSERPKEVRTRYAIQAGRPVLQRADASPADPEFDDGHRVRRVQSVIDVHAWDAAKWRGAAYFLQPDGTPALALMFENGDAAKIIFERWRARFGTEDGADAIYIAIIHDIDAGNPDHYKVLITSSVGDAVEGERVMLASRSMTVPAQTRKHVDHFTSAVAKAGTYEVMPALLPEGASAPKPMPDLAIRKHRLSVKSAPAIEPADLERMVIATGEPV
jgi:hypothetical protein